MELQDNFSELETIVRKVAPDSVLLQELKEKLCTKERSRKVSTSIITCDIFTATAYIKLKDFIIIYEVPIWDDS